MQRDARFLRRKTLHTILKRANGASLLKAESILITQAIAHVSIFFNISETTAPQRVFATPEKGWGSCSLLMTATAARSTCLRTHCKSTMISFSATATASNKSGYFFKYARTLARPCESSQSSRNVDWKQGAGATGPWQPFAGPCDQM